jgi:hypothetical protein
MIEFKFLIHKPTNTIIKYDKWLEFLNEDEVELFIRKPKIFQHTTTNYDYEEFRYKYKSKDMIFNDDFKIIYKHDLQFNELREIYNALILQSIYISPLADKVNNIIDDIYKNEIRYGLEGE